jgi:hypothetical protein
MLHPGTVIILPILPSYRNSPAVRLCRALLLKILLSGGDAIENLPSLRVTEQLLFLPL